MSAPRLEIDLVKIGHNAKTLVERLAPRGIGVTAVTKATLGCVAVAQALLDAGVADLGDSRVANIQRMRTAGVASPMTLLRSPMPSEVDRVVEIADLSLNTEVAVLALLSAAAERRGQIHRVLLMVELGDLREGIMPEDLAAVVRQVALMPGVRVEGVGTNLACRSGVVPDDTNMADLDTLVVAAEATLGRPMEVVSGGNSATLGWALDGRGVGRVTNLRLGEAILLGRNPLDRLPISGLHTDAFTLVAEVIESKVKPSRPWGKTAQSAFGSVGTEQDLTPERRPRTQSILALGRQDTDPEGLTIGPGAEILGASSDHLVVRTDGVLPPGTELSFQVGYGALSRAMASPFIGRRFSHQ